MSRDVASEHLEQFGMAKGRSPSGMNTDIRGLERPLLG